MSLIQKAFNPDISIKNKYFYGANAVIQKIVGKKIGIVHVVKYPKCGGSWVRDMIRTHMDNDVFLGDQLLRKHDVFLAHRLFTSRYHKPVIVVRYPRDVYVSFYHFKTSYVNRSKKPAIFYYYVPDPNLE